MKKTLSKKARWCYAFCLMAGNLVYMLTASFVLQYYNVYLGLSAGFVGTILMAARVFDAINDPLTGIVVAKCRFKSGKFRPWLISGSIINGAMLLGLFAVPSSVYTGDSKTMMMVWCGVTYMLWSITYDMFDIPIWSVIPAVAGDSKARDDMAAMGRTAATIGCGIVSILGLKIVELLGGLTAGAAGGYTIMIEGFKWFALIIYVIYVVTSLIFSRTIKDIDKHLEMDKEKSPSIGEMFRALFRNNQAIALVLSQLLILFSTYVTSNFIIYFFQFDIGRGSANWINDYTFFNTAMQGFMLLSTMAFYPLLRLFMSRKALFITSCISSIAGYILLCLLAANNLVSIWLLLIPCFLISVPAGLFNVMITAYLADVVDYGEYQSGHRDESVIFSLQTLVTKASSGFATGLAGWIITWIGLNTAEGAVNSSETLMAMRIAMAGIPFAGIIIAFFIFVLKFKLDDKTLKQINYELEQRRALAGASSENTAAAETSKSAEVSENINADETTPAADFADTSDNS